jgi:hypothetical protein
MPNPDRRGNLQALMAELERELLDYANLRTMALDAFSEPPTDSPEDTQRRGKARRDAMRES